MMFSYHSDDNAVTFYTQHTLTRWIYIVYSLNIGYMGQPETNLRLCQISLKSYYDNA